MTTAERDAAIAALERVQIQLWQAVSDGGLLVVGLRLYPVVNQVIDAEIARLRGEGEHG